MDKPKKSIKEIAEEALHNAKLPKSTTVIKLSFAGEGKPSSKELKDLAKSLGLPYEEKEPYGDSDMVGQLKGIMNALGSVIERCEGKAEPEENETEEPEED